MSQLATKSKHDLILESRAFAALVVKRVVKSMSLPADVLQDLNAAADSGLVDAAESFDPNKGVEFKQFAYLRIRGAVIDAVRQVSSLSRNAYSYQKALEAVQNLRESDIETVQSHATRNLSGDEMLAKVFDIAADGALAFRLSFEEVEVEANDEANHDLNPEEEFNRQKIRKKLLAAIATLSEPERLIIESFYFHDKSFIDIANEESGLSKSWVSRLHKKALEKLREAAVEAQLEDALLTQ